MAKITISYLTGRVKFWKGTAYMFLGALLISLALNVHSARNLQALKTTVVNLTTEIKQAKVEVANLLVRSTKAEQRATKAHWTAQYYKEKYTTLSASIVSASDNSLTLQQRVDIIDKQLVHVRTPDQTP